MIAQTAHPVSFITFTQARAHLLPKSDAADNLLSAKHDDNMGSNKHVHFITKGMPGLSHTDHESTVDQTLPDLAAYWAG